MQVKDKRFLHGLHESDRRTSHSLSSSSIYSKQQVCHHQASIIMRLLCMLLTLFLDERGDDCFSVVVVSPDAFSLFYA